MSFVETETNGQIFTIRLNRPERLNALSTVIREGMAEAFTFTSVSIKLDRNDCRSSPRIIFFKL